MLVREIEHYLGRLMLLLVTLTAACSVTSGALPPPAPAEPVSRQSDAPRQSVPAPSLRVTQPSSDQIPIDDDDAIWGSPTAPVTIVEFSDLECPFCARAQATLSELSKRYGPEKLRIVYKHNPLPFHPSARQAAEFAQAVQDSAGPAAALAFAGFCLSNQTLLRPEAYRRFLGELRLDAAAIEAAAGTPDVIARVQRDVDLAAKLGASGTPTFFVNGTKLSGAQALDRFVAATDLALDGAARLLAAGTAPGDVYRLLVALNFETPPAVGATKSAAPPDLEPWKIPLGKAPQRGPRDALVTIVAFYDYECPFCKRVQETVNALLTRYPDDVRLVVRHNPLPFHPRAYPAAQLAIEARVQRGDPAFFDVTQRLFGRSPDLDDDALLEVARELKLDPRRAKRALQKGSHARAIEEDADLAFDFQARGIPHFFINGVRLAGAQPLESFVVAVERERERARALLSTGVRREDVYNELMKTAKLPPTPEMKAVSAGKDPPVRGPARPLHVIEVFSDFECPFCKRVEQTIAELDKRRPGEIRWVWRNLPLAFHRDARPAAVAALEARAQRGDRGFWAMHAALFESSGTDAGLGEETLMAIATRLNLDVERFRAALASGTHDAAIDADVRAANDAGITGTPAFIIDGYYLSGAQPIRAFEKILQQSKARAKAPATARRSIASP